MNPLKHIAIFIVLLVISIPFIHAEDLNLQYDSVGNLLTGDGLYRSYDGFNHLVQIRLGNTSAGNITEELTWHPIEERILVKREYYNNGTLHNKIVYINQHTIKVVNSSGTFYETYVYQDGILVAQLINGQKQAIHNDHLGSVTLITNSSGEIVENSFTSPFGEILAGGQNSRYDYTGKEFDSQAQDYDFMARRYNPQWGRFIQPDMSIPTVYNPQALNRYSYVYNNAYKYTDPDGKNPIVIALGAGFIIGSLWYMATTPLSEASGWERVWKTYGHGANVGVHAAAAISLTTAGGGLRVAKEASTLYNTLKLGALGASSYTANQMIDNEPIVPSDLAFDAFTNTIPITSQLKGGQYVSKLNPLTEQNLKVVRDVFASEGLQRLINSLFPYLQNSNSNANLASTNANKNSVQSKSSGGGKVIKLKKGETKGTATCYVSSCIIKEGKKN